MDEKLPTLDEAIHEVRDALCLREGGEIDITDAVIEDGWITATLERTGPT